MRISIISFFVALLVLQACSKKETCEDCSFSCLVDNETDVIDNSCLDNWECDFMVNNQSKVDTSENGTNGMASGDKQVFQMINSTEGESNIADDEFTNILVFEIDEFEDSFSAEDGELENLAVHYRRICFCIEPEFKAVSSGCIQGEKQSDGSWFVQGNIIVPYSFGDIEVKFDGLFMN